MLISMVNSIHKAGNKWNQVTPEPTENKQGKHWRIKDKESINKKRPRENLGSQLASAVEGQMYDSSI